MRVLEECDGSVGKIGLKMSKCIRLEEEYDGECQGKRVESVRAYECVEKIG